VKYDLLESVGENFDVNFVIKEFTADKKNQKIVNKLRTAGLLIYKKQNYKSPMLAEEKLDDIGARLEPTFRKSLKRLGQETGVSKSSARRATQLLKLRSYKTTAILALQPGHPASRVHFAVGFYSPSSKVRSIRN
jgi:hypothetical protein